MRIREATEADWSAVASLLAELGRPDARGPEEDHYRKLFFDYLHRPDADALVADQEEIVVGFVNVEYRSRLNYDTPQAWIPELIVAEGERSRGEGAALLSRAEELARERGCWSMALESANWREDAHRFYEREGWTDAAKAFVKMLPKRTGSQRSVPR